MQTVNARPGNARTFLIHMFGRGLEDDRYVVERFKSMTNGDIRPVNVDGPAKKGRRRAAAHNRDAEGRQGDAAQARRDHHLHRRNDQGRHTNMG